MEGENRREEAVNGSTKGEHATGEQGIAAGRPEAGTTGPGLPSATQESPPQQAEYPEPTVPGWYEKSRDEEASEERSSISAVPRRRGGAGQPGEPRERPAQRRQRTGPASQDPEDEHRSFTGEEKLLILDVWEKSGLPAADFSTLVKVSPHTLGTWRRKMDDEGPEGLFPRMRGPEPGSKVDTATSGRS